MLHKIDNNAQCYRVCEVPFQKEYEQRKLRLRKGQFEKVYNFLESELDGEFSVGTKYPSRNRKAWAGPLRCLWISTGKDVQQAGYFLGMIMMDVLIHKRSQWFTTKTNVVARREFETNFYWQKR